METRPELLPLYLELVEAYANQNQVALRDCFALLAADAYLASGQEDEAEELYADFARRNPGHALSRPGSLALASHDPEACGYLDHLRQNYPEDVVRDLVQQARKIRPVLSRRQQAPPPAASPGTASPGAATRGNNPPPNRGPGNPVPAPRPAPALPPRREPAPIPVRPQPATPKPAPNTPQKQLPESPAPEGEGAGIPVVNFFLLLVLIAVTFFLLGWTLIRPLLP